MTKAELLELAQEMGLNVDDSNTKAEIQAAIDEAEQDSKAGEKTKETTPKKAPKEETPTSEPAVESKSADLPETPKFEIRDIVDYWYQMVKLGEQERVESEFVAVRNKLTEILKNFTKIENL